MAGHRAKRTTEITIPFNYTPRPYQRPLYNAIADGYKRMYAVFHRRAGKDKTCLNIMLKEAVKNVGVYYYFFPTYSQGRKILWDGIDRDGFKFLDHIPEALRKKKNDAEMKIELVNGSIFQVVGTDNIDSVVGTNPIGCVFSEYSLQNPQAWDFMRPILAENNGWAAFNCTPRGTNHAYALYNIAKNSPDWFCQLLTVDDTGAITQEAIDKERRDGMSDEMIQQEFYCSFAVPVPGAYFAKEIMAAQLNGQIRRVPIEPNVPINTYWDLGIDDSTSIWLGQNVGREVHMINCYSNSGEGLVHYANWLKDFRDTRRLTFGTHVLPHDGGARSLQTGKTTRDYLAELGIAGETVPRVKTKEQGIEASRQFFGRVWFDEDGCSDGLSALKSYRKDYIEEHKIYKSVPVHDWSSHYADAWQTAALYHQVYERDRVAEEDDVYVQSIPAGPQSWMGM